MLAQYRDKDNKPTAGIRLEIPAHLMGSFKTLESFVFALRRRHGPNFRKHIKFDEYKENLFVQVGIKKEGENTDWTEYSAEEARDGLKKMNGKKGPRFDYLASPTNEQAPPAQRPKQVVVLRESSLSNWTPPARERTQKNGRSWEPAARQMTEEEEEAMN